MHGVDRFGERQVVFDPTGPDAPAPPTQHVRVATQPRQHTLACPAFLIMRLPAPQCLSRQPTAQHLDAPPLSP
eukprot:11395356-Alexandrium_andersonii.AAC.1